MTNRTTKDNTHLAVLMATGSTEPLYQYFFRVKWHNKCPGTFWLFEAAFSVCTILDLSHNPLTPCTLKVQLLCMLARWHGLMDRPQMELDRYECFLLYTCAFPCCDTWKKKNICPTKTLFRPNHHYLLNRDEILRVGCWLKFIFHLENKSWFSGSLLRYSWGTPPPISSVTVMWSADWNWF